MAKFEVTIQVDVEKEALHSTQPAWQLASLMAERVHKAITLPSGAYNLDIPAGVSLGATSYQSTSTEDIAERGRGLCEKAYWDDVRAVADEFIENTKNGEFEGEDDAERWVDETVDGHQRVILTSLAMETLRFSRNDGAYGQDFGTEGMFCPSDGSIEWSKLAYSAFLADVRDQLDAHGVNPSDPDTWTDDEDEDEDDEDEDEDEDDDIDPSEGAYTASELDALETISSGHTDNLKLESERFRVWLSRMTVADGMPYNNAITVEELEDGRWVERCVYQG